MTVAARRNLTGAAEPAITASTRSANEARQMRARSYRRWAL